MTIKQESMPKPTYSIKIPNNYLKISTLQTDVIVDAIGAKANQSLFVLMKDN